MEQSPEGARRERGTILDQRGIQDEQKEMRILEEINSFRSWRLRREKAHT